MYFKSRKGVDVGSPVPRIDYVRLRLPFDVRESSYDKDIYERLASSVTAPTGAFSGGYDYGSYRDIGTGRIISFFNVWGAAASAFFPLVPAGMLRNLLRLDIRWELPNAKITVDAMYNRMRDIGDSKRSTRLFNTRPKTKKGGRDTGGSSAIAGGNGSDRVCNYYQRGAESRALEVQFTGRKLVSIREDGFARSGGDRDAIHFSIFSAAREAATQYVVECTGVSPHEIDSMAAQSSTDWMVERQDDGLYELRKAWDNASPVEQTDFINELHQAGKLDI